MSIACTVFNFGVDGAGGGAAGAMDGADTGGAGGELSAGGVDLVRREVGGPVNVRIESSAGVCCADGLVRGALASCVG